MTWELRRGETFFLYDRVNRVGWLPSWDKQLDTSTPIGALSEKEHASIMEQTQLIDFDSLSATDLLREEMITEEFMLELAKL